MIGITWRGKLARLIIKHMNGTALSKFEKNLYELYQMRLHNQINDDEYNEGLNCIFNDYYNEIHYYVYLELTSANTLIGEKYENEDFFTAGVPMYAVDEIYHAGAIYAMAYHAATGKFASKSDCEDLRIQQKQAMLPIIQRYII